MLDGIQRPEDLDSPVDQGRFLEGVQALEQLDAMEAEGLEGTLGGSVGEQARCQQGLEAQSCAQA